MAKGIDNKGFNFRGLENMVVVENRDPITGALLGLQYINPETGDFTEQEDAKPEFMPRVFGKPASPGESGAPLD